MVEDEGGTTAAVWCVCRRERCWTALVPPLLGEEPSLLGVLDPGPPSVACTHTRHGNKERGRK